MKSAIQLEIYFQPVPQQIQEQPERGACFAHNHITLRQILV